VNVKEDNGFSWLGHSTFLKEWSVIWGREGDAVVSQISSATAGKGGIQLRIGEGRAT
jgi:translation initiation factor IF-1